MQAEKFLQLLSIHNIIPVIARPESIFFLASKERFESALREWIVPSLVSKGISVSQPIHTLNRIDLISLSQFRCKSPQILHKNIRCMKSSQWLQYNFVLQHILEQTSTLCSMASKRKKIKQAIRGDCDECRHLDMEHQCHRIVDVHRRDVSHLKGSVIIGYDERSEVPHATQVSAHSDIQFTSNPDFVACLGQTKIESTFNCRPKLVPV